MGSSIDDYVKALWKNRGVRLFAIPFLAWAGICRA